MVDTVEFGKGVVRLCELTLGEDGPITFDFMSDRCPRLNNKHIRLGKKGKKIDYSDIKKFINRTVYYKANDFVPSYCIGTQDGKLRGSMFDC